MNEKNHGIPDTEERERLANEYMENAEPHTWINCKASWGTEEVTIKLHQYSSVQGEEIFCIERQGGALCLVPQSELIILD
nr:MAG TPA_asm: hypothetical protein [Caudoviricetes sp.]